jgi:hypothetical protein
MTGTARRDSANPLRNLYATVRYDAGLTVERVLGDRLERFPRLHRWAHASEARSNCIADPWLGRAVSLGDRVERHGARMLELGAAIRSTTDASRARSLRRRYSRVERRAAAAFLEQAKHRLLAYPDDVGAQLTVRAHVDASRRRESA